MKIREHWKCSSVPTAKQSVPNIPGGKCASYVNRKWRHLDLVELLYYTKYTLTLGDTRFIFLFASLRVRVIYSVFLTITDILEGDRSFFMRWGGGWAGVIWGELPKKCGPKGIVQLRCERLWWDVIKKTINCFAAD